MVDDIFAVRLNGGVVAYVSIYVYRMSPRSTTQPHVSKFFCASAVGWATSCWKAFCKRTSVKEAWPQNLDIPDPAEKGCF